MVPERGYQFVSGPKLLFDPECHKLAEYFLADEPHTANDVDLLADAIQDTVEQWLGGRTKGSKDVSSPPLVR